MQKHYTSILKNFNQINNLVKCATRFHYDNAVLCDEIKVYSSESNLPWSKTVTNGKISYCTTIADETNLIPDTIGQLIAKNAEKRPSELCYVLPHNGGLNLSFLDLYQRVQVISQNLLNLGFKKGDRIAFILPNTHELIVSLLAAASIGIVSVFLNPAYQQVEIEYMLKKTGAKGIFMYDSFKTLQHYEIIKKICPEIESCEPGCLNAAKLPELKHVVILNSPLLPTKHSYKGTWSYNKLSDKQISNTNIEVPIVDLDDPCFILFTSGTTGFPKGALIKHSSIVNGSNFANKLLLGKNFGKLNIPIPVFHIFGLGFGVIVPLLGGNETIFPFFIPDSLTTLKSISAYKCDSLMGAPTIFIDLLNHPERKKFDISSLKTALIGASTVPPDLIAKLKSELNLQNVIIGYGMTEILAHSFTNCDDTKKSNKYAYESIGRPYPFTESKIVDPKTNITLPLNSDGELHVRGFHVTPGYFADLDKTKQTIDENGWFKTGDICSMDKDGYLYFKSRSKDIVIRGGINIYPAEVEEFLRTNPKVIDAAVVGVPDQRFGEELYAMIKIQQNNTLTLEEMKEFCNGKIAHFKIPKYLKVVDSFPINHTGKVVKTKVAEMAKAELKL